MTKFFYIVATENGICYSTALRARSIDDACKLFSVTRPYAVLISIEA